MGAAAGERNVWVVGGGDLASQFVDEGLLDELHVTVVPVVLGDGIPTFARRLAGELTLTDSRAFANGMVHLSYSLPPLAGRQRARARAWHHRAAAVCDVLEPWAHGTVVRATRIPELLRLQRRPGRDDEPVDERRTP